MSMVHVHSIKKNSGIAGQFSVTAQVAYDGEDLRFIAACGV